MKIAYLLLSFALLLASACESNSMDAITSSTLPMEAVAGPAGGGDGSAATSYRKGSSSGGGGANAEGGGSLPILMPFAPALHTPFPFVPKTLTGPILKDISLVTITFAGYPYRAEVETLGDWIVTSDWLKAVGHDYGVKGGTHIKKVVLDTPAPGSITDEEIATLLINKLKDGTLPSAKDQSNISLYAIYFPKETHIALQSDQSCQKFGGYHNGVDRDGFRFAYLVVPTCAPPGIPAISELDSIEISFSHEMIEAATDPFPLTQPGYQLTNTNNPWTLFGGEIADLCTEFFVRDGGFALQRIWSNTAASHGDPCLPARVNTIVYNVTASPERTVAVQPGQTITFTLKGWSSAPLPDWHIVADIAGGAFHNAKAQLDTKTINNGKTAILTLTIPNDVKSQDYIVITIYSYLDRSSSNFHYWPIAAYIP